MDAIQQVEVLRAACCVAGIDGDIAPKELQLIQKLAARIGVGRASLEAMLQRAQSDKNFYQAQFRILKADPTEAMKLLFGVALADGKLQQSESEVLWQLAENLGVSRKQFDDWHAQAVEYLRKQSDEAK